MTQTGISLKLKFGSKKEQIVFLKKIKIKSNHFDNRTFIEWKVDFEKNIGSIVSEPVSGGVLQQTLDSLPDNTA